MPSPHHHLPLRTWLHFLAQSVNLTTAVMSVSMAALVGAALAPAPWAATIPYGCQFLLLMLSTMPASRLMARLGRQKAFLLGCAPLALAGISGHAAVQGRQFWLLVLAHALLGVYIAFANFNRFAATDGLDATLRPRAISLVVAGGLIAAFTGPLLVRHLQHVAGMGEFAGAYLVLVALAALALAINLLIGRTPAPGLSATVSVRPATGTLVLAVLQNPGARLAMLVSALGYGLMNLLMVQASIQLSVGLCSAFDDISQAIQWHVLAMFAPSLLAGRMVQWLGTRRLSLLGVMLVAISAGINLLAVSYDSIVAALVVLGLGWNFTYVGGSALFSEHSASMPHAVELQGINDLAISILATAGAFSPALLHATIGWNGTNLLAIALCLLLLASTWRRQVPEGTP